MSKHAMSPAQGAACYRPILSNGSSPWRLYGSAQLPHNQAEVYRMAHRHNRSYQSELSLWLAMSEALGKIERGEHRGTP